MFAWVKSINDSNTCVQVFAVKNLVYMYPLETKSQAWIRLQNFVDDVGFPWEMVSDGALELTGLKTKFK